MRATITFLALTTVVLLSVARGQAPAPMVVQAAPSAAAPVVHAAPAAGAPSAALPLLQAMKAANDETLKKQEAALVQLDELQKAAEQLKIYSKRG